MRISLLLLCVFLLPVHAAEAPLEVSGATTVNVLQARQLYELGAVFIDVRPMREWSWGHVHGALHLELDSRFADLAESQWPRGVPLVIYSDSELGPHSAEAVRRAVGWGYRQVYFFRSGYFAWQLLDFPLGRGAEGELLAFTPAGR
ncbi:sulfurtransferase [Pseudomonas alcaligenes]|uniref:Sulfurtransferase n=1 Tax=Aquipseudomonas alcaligenes TaxID=43263 RepID=A0ABR7S1Y9_AQUAC|nr:rhodanese-like domain-containing protein [Pseudomonas alcaligenes]MBC9250458.1 sulfurtransferase [Pseudomonas alcaligenes]